jgi:hypothetical protein
MRSIFRSRTVAGLAAILSSAVGLSSCASELTRTGSSPAFIVIESLQGASGASPDEFGSPLFSDVITLVQGQVNGQQVLVPTVFNDLGQARVRVSMKNPTNPTGPTPINSITINRYRVVYRRADGRNTAGVDVPHPFDGATTFTVAADSIGTFGFEAVRHQAKQEPPLRNLAGDGGAQIISTIAEITFYGQDQAGNEVSATGMMSVNFGDFGDPGR